MVGECKQILYSKNSNESFRTFSLGLGVGFVVNPHQVGQGHLRVFLRRRKAGVAKQFLYGAKVRSMAEKVGRECVAQSVGVDGGIANKIGGIELHDVAGPTIRQATTAMVQEQRIWFR